MRYIKAIDFFCGAGGLTRGLLTAGIKVLAGIDHDASLRNTYEKNNEPSLFVHAKVGDVDIQELRGRLGMEEGDPVLYAACTPCQPFSTLNQKQGEDDRKEYLLDFARLVEESPPHFIIVENVPGLHTAYGRDVYDRFAAILERCRFNHIFQEMLDAKEYGVPQVRKRFIMIASRIGTISPPRRSRYVRTVRSAIARFPVLDAGEGSPEFANHVARSLNARNRAIVTAVPKDGGSRSDIRNHELLLECHKNRPKVHKDVFGRLAWDQAAPTLTCRCTDVYCGRFTHPEQDRGLSVREAAALQTFADDYVFYGGSIFQLAGQVGNAVPVELAKRLGHAVVRSAQNAEAVLQ
jgi:DNA (cytosine-5)-methyltransferase 1